MGQPVCVFPFSQSLCAVFRHPGGGHDGSGPGAGAAAAGSGTLGWWPGQGVPATQMAGDWLTGAGHAALVVGAGNQVDGGLGLAGKAGRQGAGQQLTGLEAWFRSQRGLAETLGEWAFYAAAVLIVLALVKA